MFGGALSDLVSLLVGLIFNFCIDPVRITMTHLNPQIEFILVDKIDSGHRGSFDGCQKSRINPPIYIYHQQRR
jgi:hypothetical protein